MKSILSSLIILSISWLVHAQEIGVAFGETDFTSGSSTFDFGTVLAGQTYANYIMIKNEAGSGDLTMAASSAITITGTDASLFSVTDDSAGAVLSPGEKICFELTFESPGTGTKTATINIYTDDADENPFTFTVTATVVAAFSACTVPAGDMEQSFYGSVPYVDFFGDGLLHDVHTYEAPTGWIPAFSTLLSLFLNIDINVDIITDTHTGSGALEIKNDATGFGDLQALVYCTDEPELLTGYYKFSGAVTDSGLVIVSSGGQASQTNSNTDTLVISSDASTYTEFALDIPYDGSSVDTILIYVLTTANSTTSLKLDDLTFAAAESYTGYFSGAGSGTLGDPFQVSNATQLDEVRNNLDAHYIQTADIDLDVSPYNTGSGWDPIGVLDAEFTGSYNGDGYTISNLFINTTGNNAGLFGMVDGADISNLTLTGVNITGAWYVGALTGYCKNSSIIAYCGSTGTISGTYNLGGLIGESYNSTVSGSYSTATVTGTQVIGGLIGYQNGTVTNCYARGAVDGTETVAGLIGQNAGTVETSYSTGAVTATSIMGGLTWSNVTAHVINSYWDTETSGMTTSSGGTGKTTAVMQKQAFFIGKGWNFETVWGYNAAENGGYPFLRAQGYTHVDLFDGGSGTEVDPWQISTPGQLDDTRYLLDKHYILVADLDLGGDAPEGDFYHDGEGWEPIGSNGDEFTGSLDGDGHTISNLFIDRSSTDNNGLFGDVEGATLSDLTLTAIDVTGQSFTGGLAGHVSSTTINDCSVSGDVSAYSNTGGLVGRSFDGEVNRVTSSASVTTTNNQCGGIIGDTWGTSVTRAFFSGTVSGHAYVGGIIGHHNYVASLSNSYTSGTVTGTDKTGGLVGRNENSSIEYCYSKGLVSGTTDVGGLIGNYAGGGSSITACYWDTETSGQASSAAGTGKTSEEMKSATTYIPNGWNFDDPWGMNAAENGGYPFFRSQGFTPVELFIDAGQSFTVSETASVGTSLGFVSGVVQNTSGSLQDWLITAGNDDGKFEIVASTGEVKTAASLDYESTTQYTLTLTVSDGTTTSESEDITIDIEDVDETIPVITASQVFDVDENSSEDTLGIIDATDTDPETVLQDWTITAGNDLGYFILSDSTGHLSLAPGAVLDYETTDQYVLTVTVGDGTNTSTAEDVTIEINDVDEDPVVDSGLKFSLDENASDGTLVGTVTGSDVDDGTTLESWTIASGNEEGDFDLNATTGDITVATGASLDYEVTAEYHLMVTVSDGTNTSAEEEVIIYLYQGILYVDADATGGGNNGGSWGDAYISLQSALAAADGDQQIWVAEGTYTPSVAYDFDEQNGAETRESVFEIPDSVEVYGGFNGTETLLVDRDPETNITILSGDLDGDDDSGGDNSENAYHVVFFDTVTNLTILDGFTITGGNASVTIMTNNAYGGGIFNYAVVDSSTPVVRNCIIDNNFAYRYGGGIYNQYHSTVTQAEYINCRITNNTTNNFGAGVANNSDEKNCSPVFTNCVFEGNTAYYGTIYNRCYTSGTSTPTFTNCLIINNLGTADGVAIYDAATATLAPVYTNCLIAGSKSIYNNTVIYTYTATGGSYAGEFINCTVTGNSGYYGSGMYNYQQAGTNTPVIKNSIIAGNYVSGSNKTQLVNSGATPVISYSLIEGSGGSSSWTSTYGTDGGGNLDADPLFLEPVDGIDAPSANGNYRLSSESPALDAGNNSDNGTSEDLDGETRIQEGTIDMGAYEGSASFTEDIFYVDADATGNNDGTDWANAFTDLESALAKAANGDQVWVAAGTYYPSSQGSFEHNDGTDDRCVTFQLRPGVEMYGGFAGTESSTEQRDIDANETILSGDIDQDDQSGGDSTNNAYHVVYMKDADDNTLIDGFTITRGNANSTSSYFRKGGGIRLEGTESSPQISNCTFTGNYGYNGGALNINCEAIIRSCTVTENVGYQGGGAYIWSESKWIMVDFYSNKAFNGGGVYNAYCDAVFLNCRFQGDSAYYGGGIFNDNANTTFFNCLITGNYASSLGGGIRNYESGPPDYSSPAFINTTISGNYAESKGGGMSSMSYTTPVLTNSIIWNNDAPTYPDIDYFIDWPVLSYTIHDPSIVFYTDNGNNIEQDPLFVSELDPANAPSMDGDFTVSAGSPAINSGNDDEVPVDTYDIDGDGDDGELHPLDLDENLRQDQAVDIGCYEINKQPEILSISRKDPTDYATKGNAVVFEVIFSEPVTNVDLTDFALSGGATATLSNIDEISSDTYDIDVTGISGDGQLNLDLDAGQDIEDLAGFALLATIGSEEYYYIDHTYPDAPDNLDLLTADDSGDSDSDNITSVNTPTITGTAEVGSEVTLVANGATEMGTVTADGSGDWSITSVVLDDGEYSITATTTDTVGNESAISAALSVTIDTTAPVLYMVSSSVDDDTFGPVSFLINVEDADHQSLALDSITLVTDNDVDGDISIDSLSLAATIITVSNITGSGNFHLDISDSAWWDVAGNRSQSFNTDTILVEKDDPEMSLDTIYPKTYGDGSFTLTTTTESDGTLTYSSSDEAIVSITGDQATVLKAGTVTITVDQAESDNYLAGTDEQQLVVSKASLQVTADDQARLYGEINPDLTISYSGFVSGEDSTFLTTLPVAATTADESSDVGAYDITASGGVDDNYEFTYITGSLTIGKTTLTVTANDQNRSYGDANPELTYSYAGFVNGEDSTVLDTWPVASTTADAASDVGSYDITVSGGADGNYDFTYISGTLTISKASLTVTANDQNRLYGEANPELTFTYDGFVNSEDSTILDTWPVASTTADVSGIVGSYDITVSGGADGNYDFSYNSGILTISKASITVTADDKSRLYGEANPVLTFSYDGFVNSEDSTVLDILPVASSLADVSSEAGTYDITVSGGSDGNYSFTYNSGILTILKAALSINADDKSREYGQPNPVLTVTYSGFVTGEDSTALDTLPEVETVADINSDAGTYAIQAGGASSKNYDISYTAGLLTITPAGQFITFDSLDTYDMRVTTEFELTATASSGLTVTFASSNTEVATISGTTVTLIGAGTSVIMAVQTGNANYLPADSVTRILTVLLDLDPVFVSDDSVSFTENRSGAVLDINANDGDGGEVDAGISYSLSGSTDDALFTINATTGELKFVSPPDFENPADLNGDNEYQIQVTASDGACTASQGITVFVTDVNEAPVLVTGIDDQTYQEGFVSSTVDLIGLFEDADGDTLVLSASSSNASVVTVSVTDTTLLLTEADTGTAVITVTADDGEGGTATGEFTVTVTWVNAKPVFTSGASYSIDENRTGMVVDINASDPDLGAGETGITYSISGGDDGSLFSIDPVWGYLSFNTSPNFEQPADLGADNIYRLDITASDGIDTSVLKISITVGDLDEYPQGIYFNDQEIIGSRIDLVLYETAPVDSVLGTIEVMDEDVDDEYLIEILESDGSSIATFTIVNGVLAIGDTLSYWDRNYYNLMIKVGKSGSEYYNIILVVDLVDVNEPPSDVWLEIVNAPEENSPVPMYLGQLVVQDNDPWDSHTIYFYDTIADNDNDLFEISGASLYSQASFDYETDSILEIWVEAVDDGGLSSGPVKIIIKVIDVEETGIQDRLTGIRVYPNPVKQVLWVESPVRIRKLTLMDLNGRVLDETEQHMMDISTLDAGVYILDVDTYAGLKRYKIVKE